MDKAFAEPAAMPKTNRRQLQERLNQSIDAHRLRLLKARGAKKGQFCECLKCDVTSMKPSMRCLKAGSRLSKVEVQTNTIACNNTRVTNIPQVNSVRSCCRKQLLHSEKPILHAEATQKSQKQNVPKKANLNEVKPHSDCLEPPIQHQSTAESENVSLDERCRIDGEDLLQRHDSPENKVLSSRLSSSRSISVKSEKNDDLSTTDDVQLRSLVRRLSSIHIVDSQGDEHRVDTKDIEGKILTLVNKIVSDKLSRVGDNNENDRNTGGVENTGAFTCCQTYCESDDYGDVVPQLQLNSGRPTITARSNKQSSTNTTTIGDSEDMDKYKNVVDVLLEYISSGHSKNVKSDVETARQEIKSARWMANNEYSSQRKHLSESQTTAEEYDGRSNNDMFCGARDKSYFCCNSVEPDILLTGQQKAVSSVGPANSVRSDKMEAVEDMQYRRETPCMSPKRMVSSMTGCAEPMYMKAPSTMGDSMTYGQPAVQPYMPPYRFQVQSTPQHYFCNPMVNCCPRQNVHTPYVAPFMPHRMVSPLLNPVSTTPSQSRCRYAPAPSQRSMKMQPPRTYTGFMPRKDSIGLAAMYSPVRQMPRQATGPLYRRNTGRAYVQRVQAEMM